jgi:hypothetical protein
MVLKLNKNLNRPKFQTNIFETSPTPTPSPAFAEAATRRQARGERGSRRRAIAALATAWVRRTAVQEGGGCLFREPGPSIFCLTEEGVSPIGKVSKPH